MRGATHAMIGANAVWIAYIFNAVDSHSIFLLIAGALAALLPDIDATSAKIHYIFGGIFGMFRNILKHRGFFHSILAMLGIYIISFLIFRNSFPLLPLAITFGYASHPLIDAFNGGVQYLSPYPKFLSFVPKFLRFKVGSGGDDIFFFLGALGVAFFILFNLDGIQQSIFVSNVVYF